MSSTWPGWSIILPDYLKINPLGVIPTLIHDGRPLHESGTIWEYLDESFPDPPPPAPYDERGECETGFRHIDALIGNLIVFKRDHLQKVAEKWTDAELAEKMKSIPSKERQEAWLRVRASPIPRKNATRRGRTGAIARQDGRGAETLRLAGRHRPRLFHRRLPLSPSSSGSTRRLLVSGIRKAPSPCGRMVG